VAVDVLGMGGHLLLGEAAERVLDQLELAVEVTGTVVVGQLGQGGRVSPLGHEGPGRIQGPGFHRPQRFPAPELGCQIGDNVGDEHAGQTGFQVTLGSIVEHRPGCFDGGGGMGQVVGQDLVGVDRAGLGQLTGGCSHHGSGCFDGRGCVLKIGFAHEGPE
jgi:hypothetical protein